MATSCSFPIDNVRSGEWHRSLVANPVIVVSKNEIQNRQFPHSAYGAQFDTATQEFLDIDTHVTDLNWPPCVSSGTQGLCATYPESARLLYENVTDAMILDPWTPEAARVDNYLNCNDPNVLHRLLKPELIAVGTADDISPRSLSACTVIDGTESSNYCCPPEILWSDSSKELMSGPLPYVGAKFRQPSLSPVAGCEQSLDSNPQVGGGWQISKGARKQSSEAEVSTRRGELIFDRRMQPSRPRRLKQKTREEKEASLVVRNSGGACERHRLNKRKCRCKWKVDDFDQELKRSSIASLCERGKALVEPSTALDHMQPESTPVPSTSSHLGTQSEETFAIGATLQELPTEIQPKTINTKPISERSLLSAVVPEDTLVFVCPYLFTGCRFLTFNRAQWSAHLEEHCGSKSQKIPRWVSVKV